ncbi:MULTISPECIES: argininosuccinate lyase [Falsihalocynthiibacter]
MKKLVFLGLFATLAACGVDGAPTPPETTTPTGITVSGEARMGVVTKF